MGLIVAEREANGPFVDFYDFCDRVDLSVLNKRTIESLIKAGAFDSMGYSRQGLLRAHERIIDEVVARRREEAKGQFDLFSAMGDTDAGQSVAATTRLPIDTKDFDKKVRLGFEKEMLGLYVSDHPLMGAEGALRRRTECTIAELEGVEDGTRAGGGWAGHQPPAQVDQEGRPDGGLRPRGPAGVHRGDGLPQDHAAVRAPAHRRRRGRGQGSHRRYARMRPR